MTRLLLIASAAAFAISASAADPAADMAAAMELMKPGPEHQRLAKLAGDWEVDDKGWFNGPEAPPTEAKGSARFTLLFEGRHLRQDYQGTMMGMPFTGIGYEGFDRASGEYYATWIDSMQTGISVMRGKPAADPKVVTYEGDCTNPQNRKPMRLRGVRTVISDDEFTFEMSDVTSGQAMKMEELHYHRKAPANK